MYFKYKGKSKIERKKLEEDKPHRKKAQESESSCLNIRRNWAPKSITIPKEGHTKKVNGPIHRDPINVHVPKWYNSQT